MDNADGHGTDVAIKLYTKMLKHKHNSVIIHYKYQDHSLQIFLTLVCGVVYKHM